MAELTDKDQCWVYISDDVAYEAGVVSQADAKSVTAKLKSGKTVTVDRSVVLRANKEKQDGETDNTFLRELNEATILHNVGVRYAQSDGGCYTSTGHILIAVNPFRELKIYDDSQARGARATLRAAAWRILYAARSLSVEVVVAIRVGRRVGAAAAAARLSGMRGAMRAAAAGRTRPDERTG